VLFLRNQIAFAKKRLFKGKAFIVFGPRQAGKTTFTNMLLNDLNLPVLRLNGDEFDTRELFKEANSVKLKNIIGNHKILFLDEAQRIPEIGLVIKIIVDQIKDVQVIATGSSSFELAGKINEPLTGRKYEMALLPPSYQELETHFGFLGEQRLLEQRLVFGSYPEIVTDLDMAQEHLSLIANSYLYKDVFELEQIKQPLLFQKLVKALALQVGSEVRINELCTLVGADNKTIAKYIALLEQAFVLFSVPSYSKNVRNELKKSRKIYFYDTGVINAVTKNYNPLSARNDVGALWENYLMSERKKYLFQTRNEAEMYFWRTTQQQEIDYVEVLGDTISAYEFKWNKKAKKRLPLTFSKAYPKATFTVVDKENYWEFLRQV
jgi:predicted AAA+ superfamily ATPase